MRRERLEGGLDDEDRAWPLRVTVKATQEGAFVAVGAGAHLPPLDLPVGCDCYGGLFQAGL